MQIINDIHNAIAFNETVFVILSIVIGLTMLINVSLMLFLISIKNEE